MRATQGLTPAMLRALTLLRGAPMTYSVAGFHRPSSIEYFASKTLTALADRGLCVVQGSRMKRVATISAEGRERLRRIREARP